MTPPLNENDTLPPSQDPALGQGMQAPPTTLWGILGQLGPGLIIAGSIVGSGELIATTKTGAQAGITLLWLIIIGCLIKVFVQIELGRFALTHGETTLSAMNQVPGPRFKVSWLLWFWMGMMVCSLGQLGGIVGGVGQAMAISCPLTGDYLRIAQLPGEGELINYARALKRQNAGEELTREQTRMMQRIQESLTLSRSLKLPVDESIRLAEQIDQAQQTQDKDRVKVLRSELKMLTSPPTKDDLIWAVAATLVTILLLYRGSYDLIQNVSTALVVSFTFVTIGNVISLQMTADWHIPASEFLRGLSFQLPEGSKAVTTALSTFGIIGVGAAELVQYPYWCLEKGYGKYTGKRDNSEAWAIRARGWLKVMRYDAWCSMVIYTVATLAFFLMGVAVLHSEGRDPDGTRMIVTLASAYVPVFGIYAKWLFLVGALAVLYSTFLIANAGHTRTLVDCFKLVGFLPHNDEAVHKRWLTNLSVALPLICLVIYGSGFNPVTLVLLGGFAQGLLLPMLGIAALYFRFNKTDARIRPSFAWDVCLIISCIGMGLSGGWAAYTEIVKHL